MLTVVTLVVVGLLWARTLVVQPKAETPPPLPRAAKSPPVESVARLAQAQRGGNRARVLRFSAGDINELLTSRPEAQQALEDAGVERLRIAIRDKKIVTTATVRKAGIAVGLAAEGQLLAQDGMLLYVSDQIRVGRVPAPAALRDSLDLHIQDAFRRFEQRAGGRIERVTVADDRITLHLVQDAG